MSVVFVTNYGDSEHTDSYLGVSYTFRRGVTLELPENAARELLGYGHTDKTPFVVRLGWPVTSLDVPQAIERLNKIEISREPPVQNRYLPSAVGVVPLHSARRAGRKANARAA
jgi:hypothetical protein